MLFIARFLIILSLLLSPFSDLLATPDGLVVAALESGKVVVVDPGALHRVSHSGNIHTGSTYRVQCHNCIFKGKYKATMRDVDASSKLI